MSLQCGSPSYVYRFKIPPWGHHVVIFLSVPFRVSRGEHTNLQPYPEMVMHSSTLLNDAHVRLQNGGKKQTP